MSNEIRLKYLTDEGLAGLKQSFTHNLSEYKNSNQKHFLDFFNDNNYLLDSAYCVENFTDKLIFTGDDDNDDLENIKILYNAMRKIPAYVMMDDRFWAAINHTIMWDYIIKRRNIKTFNLDSNEDKEKLYNSFFTHTRHGKKRGTYVNCVSRLWWAGKYSYDESVSNPYELTEEMCKKGFASTIILLSSSNIMNKGETRKAFLLVIRNLRMAGINVKRDDMVAGIRYLNLIAGSSLIDIMCKNEIEEILEKFYFNFYKNE